MLKQVEIDASKNESKIRSEVRNRNRVNIERKLNESNEIITHNQTSKYGNIGNRNYEPIIRKSKSDEYDDGI